MWSTSSSTPPPPPSLLSPSSSSSPSRPPPSPNAEVFNDDCLLSIAMGWPHLLSLTVGGPGITESGLSEFGQSAVPIPCITQCNLCCPYSMHYSMQLLSLFHALLNATALPIPCITQCNCCPYSMHYSMQLVLSLFHALLNATAVPIPCITQCNLCCPYSMHYSMQLVMERGSIDKSLNFDVALIQLSFHASVFT